MGGESPSQRQVRIVFKRLTNIPVDTGSIINTSRRRGRESLHRMEVSAAGLRDSRYTSGYKAGITFSLMWSTFNRL